MTGCGTQSAPSGVELVPVAPRVEKTPLRPADFKCPKPAVPPPMFDDVDLVAELAKALAGQYECWSKLEDAGTTILGTSP